MDSSDRLDRVEKRVDMTQEETTGTQEEQGGTLELATLAPNAGSRKSRKRLGRGEASGVGKTSGKGHKGQKARAGASIPAYFEGGQMPLYRRVGKIGFQSYKRITGINQYRVVDVTVLNNFEDGATVDIESLASIGYGLKSNKRAGIKIVGNGELTKKLTIKVQAATKGALASIEKAGGSFEATPLRAPKAEAAAE